MGNCMAPKRKSKAASKKASNEKVPVNNSLPKKANSAPKSWDLRRQQLNPADYVFKNKSDDTLIKAPGSINGEQFVIDTCQNINGDKNCDIYLCDNTATVLIDDCENCKIYIGPCSSSVFLRKMKNCQVIMACQQLRTRDCENLDIMIYSQTPPIIESSNDLRFACFKFGYFELQQQFQKAELNIWNNRWSEIYDFTKKKSKNFSFLPEDTDPYQLIPRLSTIVGGEFSDPTSEEIDLLVPISTGDRPKLYEEEAIFILVPGYENAAEQMVPEINRQNNFEVVKSRAFALEQAQIQQLPQAEQTALRNLSGSQDSSGKNIYLFVHFGGKSLSTTLNPMLTKAFADKKCYHISTNNKAVTDVTNLVFEVWREGE